MSIVNINTNTHNLSHNFTSVKVIINQEEFIINTDLGIQDVAYISLAAANLYGRNSIPKGKPLPIIAHNDKKEYLHPKMTILNYSKLIGNLIHVKIKEELLNPSLQLTDEEKKWISQAYGNEKNQMDLKFKFLASVQDFKYSIKYFYLKFKIIYENEDYSKINDSNFNNNEENSSIYEVILTQNDTTPEIHEYKTQVSIGEIQIIRVYYKDTPETSKEITDFNRNKLIVEKFPEPILKKEKENIIKRNEMKVLNKERELQGIISRIEEEKLVEKIRIKELQDFLESVPYTLDELYEEITNQIPNSESEMEGLFQLFQNNEFHYFRSIYSLFEDYSIYFNNQEEYGEYIDIYSAKHSILTYFNKSNVAEYESIQISFKNYYIDKMKNDYKFKFDDYFYSIIHTLYFNNNLNSFDMIPSHLEYFFNSYNKVKETEAYNSFFKDPLVVSQIKSNLVFFIRLFNKEAQENIMPNYKEMTITTFSSILHSVSKENRDYNFIDLWKEIQFTSSINFISFLQSICQIGENAVFEKKEDILVSSNINKETDNNLETKAPVFYEKFEKIGSFIEAFKKTFPEHIPNEEVNEENEMELDMEIENEEGNL